MGIAPDYTRSNQPGRDECRSAAASAVPPLLRADFDARDNHAGHERRVDQTVDSRGDLLTPVDRGVIDNRSHDGKHLPNATSSFGDPLMRSRRCNKAQSRLRSFARKANHVSLSAVTLRSASPW